MTYQGPAETAHVNYHSQQWIVLVETGWITVSILHADQQDRTRFIPFCGLAFMARGEGWTC